MWCVCVLINHTTTTVVNSMPIILLTVLQEMVVVSKIKVQQIKKNVLNLSFDRVSTKESTVPCSVLFNYFTRTYLYLLHQGREVGLYHHGGGTRI